MAKIHNNGGVIGKTLDFNSSDAYTTGSSNKKNSGIWNLSAAVPEPIIAPDYTAFSTYSIGNINEGVTTNFSIPIPNAPPSGTSVLVSVSGYTDSGVSASQNGEPAVFNSSGELQFTFTFPADNTTEGDQTLTFTLAATDSLGNPTGSATNTTGTLLDTSKTVAYEITGISGTGNEGSPAEIQFRVSNSTETLYWTTTAGSSDVNPVSGSSSWVGTTTVGNDTWYNHAVTIFIIADSLTEGNEQFTFNLRSGSTSGTIQDSFNYTIQDTSKLLEYGVYAVSDSTPDEGTTPYVDFYVTNSSPTMYWDIDSGSSDFNGGIAGSLDYYTTVSNYPSANNTAYLYRVNLSVTADDTTEGNENHTIRFRTTSTSGTIRASQVLTVQDTSQDPPAGGGPELSDVLATYTGSNAAWQAIDLSSAVSQYAGEQGRLVFQYITGSSFTGDIQLDDVNIGSTNYSFENSGNGWETTTNDTTVATYTDAYYKGLSWSPVAVGTISGRWNSDSGGTPSTGTGLTTATNGTYYLYAETTSWFPNKVIWLRSPLITLDTAPTLNFDLARSGDTIGSLRVFWEGTLSAGIDYSSSFTEISNRHIDSDIFMGNTTDYTGPYDVHQTNSVLASPNGSTARVYLAVKYTSATTFYSDLPIAGVQHFNSSGTLQNSWIFNTTTGGSGSTWQTTTTAVAQGATGMSTTPATAAGLSYTSISTGATTNRMNWATSTGSSNTGAWGGISGAYTSSPITTGTADAAIPQIDNSYYMYAEASSSTLDTAVFARSPAVTINEGDYFVVVHAVTGFSTNRQDADDCLWFAVY